MIVVATVIVGFNSPSIFISAFLLGFRDWQDTAPRDSLCFAVFQLSRCHYSGDFLVWSEDVTEWKCFINFWVSFSLLVFWCVSGLWTSKVSCFSSSCGLFFPFLLLLSLAKAFPIYFLGSVSPVDFFIPLGETRRLEGTEEIEELKRIFNFLIGPFFPIFTMRTWLSSK